MSLFIGIDSGTQSTKAVVLDPARGKVLAQAHAPHRMIAGLPVGAMEQHPADWTRALDRVLKAVCAQVDPAKIRGIGVSGQQHGFVALDGKRQVIRPAKLWCDTTTIAECALITKALGGEKAAIAKTGNLILPGFTAPKILWLKRHEPKHYQRLRHVLLPHDYLNLHLTGNLTMEAGDASGTALMDVRRREWSADALAAIDHRLADWLPSIGRSDALAGVIRPALAKALGLRWDTIVSAGGGDNMMGAIGTGNVVPGVVTASFGTSGTIYAYSDKPIVDPRGEIAAFCSSTGGWLPLLCTMNVTTVTEQVRGLFGMDFKALDRAVTQVPAGSDGLVLLPYLAGERTPNVPDGSGVYFGLHRGNFSTAHLARAAMEGATLGMNYGLRRLAALGVKAREIRVTGGGAKSSVWRQMMADVFGVAIVAMQEEEGAALGGAIQAAWSRGIAEGDRTKLETLAARTVAVNESSRCRPDAKRAARYREIQAIQDSLSVTLRPVFTASRAK